MEIGAYCEPFEMSLIAHKRAAPNTVAAYMRDVRAFVGYARRQKIDQIDAITDSAIAGYLWHLKKERLLTARTIARAIASLRSFFAFLHQEHAGIMICVDKMTTPKQRATIPHVLNIEDLRKLLEGVQRDRSPQGRTLAAMIFLLYGTGIRVSELVRLTLAHVRCDERLIKVLGKGSKERLIPLSPELQELISTYITEIRAAALKNRESEWLFAHVHHGKVRPFTRQEVWYRVHQMGKKNGVRLYPHLMRHSMATHMLHEGVDLRSLQVLLGHEQITTTQVYTHVDTGQLRAIYNAKHQRTK